VPPPPPTTTTSWPACITAHWGHQHLPPPQTAGQQTKAKGSAELLTFWPPLCDTFTSTEPSSSAYQLIASSPWRNTGRTAEERLVYGRADGSVCWRGRATGDRAAIRRPRQRPSSRRLLLSLPPSPSNWISAKLAPKIPARPNSVRKWRRQLGQTNLGALIQARRSLAASRTRIRASPLQPSSGLAWWCLGKFSAALNCGDGCKVASQSARRPADTYSGSFVSRSPHSGPQTTACSAAGSRRHYLLLGHLQANA